MHRRRLLRRSVALAAAPAFIPRGALAQPGRPGPNDRVRVAFIGLGGRARALLTQRDTNCPRSDRPPWTAPNPSLADVVLMKDQACYACYEK
jgi:hypothetical protein